MNMITPVRQLNGSLWSTQQMKSSVILNRELNQHDDSKQKNQDDHSDALKSQGGPSAGESESTTGQSIQAFQKLPLIPAIAEQNTGDHSESMNSADNH